MILTKEEILKGIQDKRIKIEPFKKEQVGPASIDLHLSNNFRRYKKTKKIDVGEETTPNELTKKIVVDKISIKPEEFLLGITKEKVTLPENLCGLLTGRSRFARLGIAVHATAAFIQPGINNKQVLEIKNLSNNTLTLHKGMKICQLILIKTVGKAKYSGKYQIQQEL